MNNINDIYLERFSRYTIAMNNEKPDMVPIRPFVAEFTAKYAGLTAQDVSHDYNAAFWAARKCAKEFNWDAVVSNMVYVWTGLVKAISLNYYAVPGIEIPSDTGFQYLEPSLDNAHMKENEYDDLIKNPTEFLFNKWLPRIASDVVEPGSSGTYRNNLSFLKGGMAMMQYFSSFPEQARLLKEECGTVSALAGILKAPFDIIADKLRGYEGLVMDMYQRPEKVIKACEALVPHLVYNAISGADPSKNLPIGLWMHRGCSPFISPEQFKKFYWPTLKEIICSLWEKGYRTLFYAEGEWNIHLDLIRELPEKSIIFHVDKGDIFEVNKKIGDKFCISGGVPNDLLAFGSTDDVCRVCKKIIDEVAPYGGYIMDASAIMQNDTKIENLKALTNYTREYGIY